MQTTIGTTRYSEDGKKSVTITGSAPARRDRYHADYYPVTINNNGVEEGHYLSSGVISNRFPRTTPKPETDKAIKSSKEMAKAIKQLTTHRIQPAIRGGNGYSNALRFDRVIIDQHLDTDEFVILNLGRWLPLMLLENGFQCRKVIVGQSVMDAWSK
jgi:hypothetical protein|tara:strand:- start:220 stop:690 length:471 start_codon:yes stop_codon:yes gene_type:complete